jgi:hypothetical protein
MAEKSNQNESNQSVNPKIAEVLQGVLLMSQGYSEKQLLEIGISTEHINLIRGLYSQVKDLS